MSQLTQMRQRIRAIESIKKITHAMRLISMSSRSRLKQKKDHLENYKNAFNNLAGLVGNNIYSGDLIQRNRDSKNTLVILVSSQKGLCGNFNSQLFRFAEPDVKNYKTGTFISVGKYSVDYLNSLGITPIASYNNYSTQTYVNIAHAIAQIIISNKLDYSSIIVYSNYPKSFFIQKPQKTDLFDINGAQQPTSKQPHEFIFEQSPQDLKSLMEQFVLVINITQILFNSLLAEQCARFLSMDAATRNAEKILNQMKLEYNKTRQAAITKELTELSATL